MIESGYMFFSATVSLQRQLPWCSKLLRWILPVFFCLISTEAGAQKTMRIQFNPVYDSLPLVIGKKYPFKTDSMEIAVLKFYISGIQLYQNEERVDGTGKNYHLFDIENPATAVVACEAVKKTTFNRVVFSVGVDSTANVSGAMGGDLDPVLGMYWTWQSGYINFKLEGITGICPARKHYFTYHIGGYEYPNNTMQTVALAADSSISSMVINVDVAKLLNQLQLQEVYEVMSPGEKAVNIAQKIGAVFTVKK